MRQRKPPFKQRNISSQMKGRRKQRVSMAPNFRQRLGAEVFRSKGKGKPREALIQVAQCHTESCKNVLGRQPNARVGLGKKEKDLATVLQLHQGPYGEFPSALVNHVRSTYLTAHGYVK